jgi:hypothetical protein
LYLRERACHGRVGKGPHQGEAALKVLVAVILAFWIASAVLFGLIAGTLAIVPIAMQEQVAPDVLPLLFTAIALSGSILAAFLARLIPAIARSYSLRRLILAGCVGWPLAWWVGVQTRQALESAGSHGLFAISSTLPQVTVWNGLVAIVALAILLVHPKSATPPAAPAVHRES